MKLKIVTRVETEAGEPIMETGVMLDFKEADIAPLKNYAFLKHDVAARRDEDDKLAFGRAWSALQDSTLRVREMIEAAGHLSHKQMLDPIVGALRAKGGS